MEGTLGLFVFVSVLASFQVFESKTIVSERKARSYINTCRPKENYCMVQTCIHNHPMLSLKCFCPRYEDDHKCACTDHTGKEHGINEKFMTRFSGWNGNEWLHCGCREKGPGDKNLGYCRKGCVDHNGKIYPSGTTYDFDAGANGKYSCDCRGGKALCAKGFIIPVKPKPRLPGPLMPVLPPRPPLILPPRPRP